MTVYYWCRGQDDNIGDVVLRRRLLRTLQSSGRSRVLLGTASDGFLRAMQLSADDQPYTSRRRWMLDLYKDVLKGTAVLVFNPGEVVVGGKSAMTHSLLLPAQLLLWRRRSSFRAGVSVRGRHRFLELPFRLSVRLTTRNCWRDTATSERYPGQGAPDWAFDEPLRLPTSQRDTFAITYRGDRPHTPEFAEALRDCARILGLQPVVFTQVRRDNEKSRQLAEELECEIVPWDDSTPHDQQELRVRQLMSRSAVVASDRIHALIMGLTQGASPLGVMQHIDSKVAPHFTQAGIRNVSFDCSNMTSGETVERSVSIARQRPEILRQAAEASSSVRSLAQSLLMDIREANDPPGSREVRGTTS